MELIDVFERKPINKISVISLNGKSQVMTTLSESWHIVILIRLSLLQWTRTVKKTEIKKNCFSSEATGVDNNAEKLFSSLRRSGLHAVQHKLFTH